MENHHDFLICEKGCAEILKYEYEVRKLLCQILNLDNIDNISNTEDLQVVGMDSLKCIELIIEIENRFEIMIPDEKLGIEYVHNIYDICKLVEEVMKDEKI